MKQITDLSGKKFLITGASSEIGRTSAILLSQLGASVVMTARNEKRLKDTLKCMKEPMRHFLFCADLADFKCVETLVKESVECDGKKLDGSFKTNYS